FPVTFPVTFVPLKKRNAIRPLKKMFDILSNTSASKHRRKMKPPSFDSPCRDESNDGGFAILPKISPGPDRSSNLGPKTARTGPKTDTGPVFARTNPTLIKPMKKKFFFRKRLSDG